MKYFKPYLVSFISIVSMICGGLTGYVLGDKALIFKPIADIFLNLLLTAVVPLVFFSIASAVASIKDAGFLLKLLRNMLISFIFTGLIAALFMMVIVMYVPPANNVVITLTAAKAIQSIDMATQFVTMFTVSDFSQLFSVKNLLPLIIFSLLVGLAAAHTKHTSACFTQWLQAGDTVFMKIIALIMYLAPLGFFAFFAVLVAQFGPQLLSTYLRVTLIYYSAAIIYFFIVFTAYAYLAGGWSSIKAFWKNVPMPAMTSLATCSSVACIPVNLQATEKMGVSPVIYETIIPLGAVMHKDGSVLGAMTKIAFLFGIYGLSFHGLDVIATAIVISILVGTVMGAIPSGGMLGEMLILSLYGFPPQSLLVIAAISIIIDPIATMLNVTGDSLCCMLVGRFTKLE